MYSGILLLRGGDGVFDTLLFFSNNNKNCGFEYEVV